MNKLSQKGLMLLFAGMLFACDPPVQERVEKQTDPASEQLIRANTYMQQRHQDHIAAFLERVGWQAEKTASGLWLVLEKKGTGKGIGLGSRVSYSFESTLLDGTPCYQASILDPKVITMGKGEVESGVEQGLQLLSEGAEAILMIPPHLAHGNFGDRKKIPGNSVLIYRLRVLKVD
jgi:FKBP-type peptidyl-prolyl cis-trans isomerase